MIFMRKKVIFVGIILIILLLIVGVTIFKKSNENTPYKPELSKEKPSTSNLDEEINVVTSLEDKITENTIWCGTFNLIWNDLKNDLAKQDIVFTPQLEMIENLNRGTFTTDYLSEKSYYKVYGFPDLNLKQEIEKAIKDKFNEKSEILDEFDWENHNPDDYFLYAMLKKEFEFPKVFTKFENETFKNYENVKYFGIDKTTSEEVRSQVKVLYYNSKDDFAIKLLTKNEDEVIVSKGSSGNNFKEIYDNVINLSEEYEGSQRLLEDEIVKIPNIKFKTNKEFKEIENKTFYFSNGDPYKIDKALQTVEFELDEKGGKIKSEAGMMVLKESIVMPEEIREFIVDDTFNIFLVEKDKDLPYFAAKISDISKVQDSIENNDLEIDENSNTDALQSEESVSKLARMYIEMIDDIMKQDEGLQGNTEFISIDFTNFRRPLTESEKAIKYKQPNFEAKEEEEKWLLEIKSRPLEEETKKEIIEHLEKNYPEVEIKQNTYEELVSQGLATKDEGIEKGILIHVSSLPEVIEENKAKINLTKYRGPLGADFIDYEMKYKKDRWNLKVLSFAIS